MFSAYTIDNLGAGSTRKRIRWTAPTERMSGYLLPCRHQEGCSKPAPIDAVMSNPRTVQIHDLYQIDLIACGSVPRILPGQGLPIEKVATGAVPTHEFIGPLIGSTLKERPNLVVTDEYPAFLIEDPGDERSLEDRLGQVQVEQRIDVVGLRPAIPFSVDERRVVSTGCWGICICGHATRVGPKRAVTKVGMRHTGRITEQPGDVNLAGRTATR